MRGAPRHYTYSKLMCWVALDRLLRLHDAGKLRIDAARFRTERTAIESAIEARGYNQTLGAYSSAFDAPVPDASLLLMARFNYRPAHDPRLRATFDCIERTLTRGDLVHRYPPGTDDFASREGAFVIASFWAVDYLVRCGAIARARARFERLLARANDVGLYSEEIDSTSGVALGNFPQAFSHVGLIVAAQSLADAARAQAKP
jgi:GH15 family glucan-1,4-alpha-glucosidase